MIIGIDFGTTNSAAAVMVDGQPQIIPSPGGASVTPTCVSLDEQGQVLVGEAARLRQHTHPELTTGRFKRLLGSSTATKLGKKKFRPEELAALVLKDLWTNAVAHLGRSPEEAVVTVPAYFTASQRYALKDACQVAGVPVERLINEPTAAAMAYGLHENPEAQNVLICDLGGGTFDVTMLLLEDGIMEVLASSGDAHLGGEDVSDAFLDLILERCFSGEEKDDLDPTHQGLVRLQAERAKMDLSEQEEVGFSCRLAATKALPERTLSCTLTRQDLEDVATPILNRMAAPVLRVLADAQLTRHMVDAVILVGGATRMPLVSQTLEKILGQPALDYGDPETLVAMGAAVQGALKARQEEVADFIVTDVTPFSMGVDTSREVAGQYVGGFMMPVIPRNTTIPVSRSQIFSPVHADQTRVEFNIFQGEGRLTADNEQIGHLLVKGIPREFKGEREVEVRFTFDLNGLLEVEAFVLATGKKASTVISKHARAMKPSEIKSAIKNMEAIKIHPREERSNQELLARARSLYLQLPMVNQEFLGDYLDQFYLSLETQEERLIEAAKTALNDAMAMLSRPRPMDE